MVGRLAAADPRPRQPSLGIQLFLMVAAPMRKYSLRRCFRLCVWLAYVSSDAVAIYALGTLFNRHARAATGSSCNGIASDKARILEVLWAPVLLIHLGGQEELMAYTIEDNNLWIKHTVTLVSQVAVALYAFYKSWWHNPRDGKLLVSEILLFIIGVVSCSEKPWALKKASSNRSESLSAIIQGTKKRTRLAMHMDDLLLFSGSSGEESNLPEGARWYNICFSSTRTESSSNKKHHHPAGENYEVLSKQDKIHILLSDISLSAAADELVNRGRAARVQDILRPLSTQGVKELKNWLRGAFALMYTRASLVFTPTYLVYHVLAVPILHVAALTLFVRSNKDGYDRTDVSITYTLLCLTAALDVFPVFIRQLLYRAMSLSGVPALCETVPGYNLVGAVLRRRHKAIGWLVRCATGLGYYNCNCKCKCKCGGDDDDDDDTKLYEDVSRMVLADLVDAQGRDLANYRVFTVPYRYGPAAAGDVGVGLALAGGEIEQSQSSSSRPGAPNWALSEEQQKVCGPRIRSTLRCSFDRSVLVWHIATDLCYRVGEQEKKAESRSHRLLVRCTEAISSYMARLLNSHPDMLLTGSRQYLVGEAMDEFEAILYRAIGVDDNGSKSLRKDDLIKIIDVGEEDANFLHQVPISQDNELQLPIQKSKAPQDYEYIPLFHIPEACGLAKELLGLEPSTRWRVMYRVWLGMLFYSASMCRGYLHAKSLGEGGEFLSYVWLVLSLKGAKTLTDKLQMLVVEGDDG